jgi:hypothetical protein
VKIYQVIATEELRHEVDPIKGVRARKETVLARGGSTSIADGEGGTYEIGPDGSFEVPDELGHFLLKQPGWYEGVNPLGGPTPAEAPKTKSEKS